MLGSSRRLSTRDGVGLLRSLWKETYNDQKGSLNISSRTHLTVCPGLARSTPSSINHGIIVASTLTHLQAVICSFAKTNYNLQQLHIVLLPVSCKDKSRQSPLLKLPSLQPSSYLTITSSYPRFRYLHPPYICLLSWPGGFT